MLIPNPWLLLGAGAVAVAGVAAAGATGYSLGRDAGRADMQGELDGLRKSVAETERSAAAQAESRRLVARAADAEFARWRADQEARRVRTLTDLRSALQRQVSCPAGAKLADVPVPVGVLDGLRRAGADRAADSPGSAASAPR